MNRDLQKNSRFLLPTYHEIEAGETEYVYGSAASSLAAQLASIRDLPHGPVVTFDDAFLSQYEFGVPALAANGAKGIFFAIPERTSAAPEYMDWNKLRELIRLGHEVQSHSYSHVALTRCSDIDLKRELEQSKSVLEQNLGSVVTAISIPFGRWDNRVLQACRNAGYSRIYTSDPNPYAIKDGVELIGRFMVRNSMTTERFRQLAVANSSDLFSMRLMHGAKGAVRHLIGDRNYHLLWCFLSRRDSNPDGEYV